MSNKAKAKEQQMRFDVEWWLEPLRGLLADANGQSRCDEGLDPLIALADALGIVWQEATEQAVNRIHSGEATQAEYDWVYTPQR